MATNRLVLRSTGSPYTFPLPDIVKGSVLSWSEVDNNFIFLKGLDIKSGSVSGTDLILERINGSNISIDLSAFTGGTGTDVFVTGGTYSASASTLTFTNNTGGTFSITGVTGGSGGTDYYTTGFTFNPANYDITVSLNNGTDLTQNLGILAGDLKVTGGTYNPSTGVATFTNNSGGTFQVTGFLTGYTDIYTTGFTYDNTTNTLSISDTYGSVYNALIDQMSGLTINGNLTVTGTSNLNNVTASTITNLNYIDFNTGYTPTQQIGRIHWDQDYGTLDVDLEGNNVNLKVGLDNLYYIKNQSGSTINKGRVVRAAGTLGSSGRILGEYMIADGTIPHYFTLGIAGENILNGEDGYVYEFGLIKGLNTTGSLYGETWSGGTILYVHPTIAGGLTSIEPVEPNLKIQMAIVIDADSNGSLFVRPSLGYNIGDLHNVQTSGQTNGDLLIYNSGTTIFEFGKTLTGNYLISGGLSATTGTFGQLGIYNQFIFPTTDGSPNQVLQTDGAGNVSWATVSGGTGSTSPAGLDTQIQFNQGGSFGANSGLTYDYGTNVFKTEAVIGNSTNLFENGISFIGPSSGVTSILYNNALSATSYSFFLNGDLSSIADDYSTILGYTDFGTNDRTLVNLRKDVAQMQWVDDVNSRESEISLNNSGVSIYNNTGTTSTGIYITNQYGVNVNLFNTGQSQTFLVTRETAPSVYTHYFSVDTNGYVTINEAYTFPNTDGSPSQVLQTDGSGNVSWSYIFTSGSTTANAGVQTLPSNPLGFIITNLNGTPVKIPYYDI